MLERVLHRLLCDLIKGDAADLFALLSVRTQLNRKVSRDRFAFAIRVRRKEDLVSLQRPPSSTDRQFSLCPANNQLGYKRALLQFHANVVFRQIHDVPNRRADLEALA